MYKSFARMAIQRRLNVGLQQDHVAIMKKSWGLTKKIVTGEKTMETRWYKNKAKPWDEIFPGDKVYFKDSGEPVSVRAKVKKVEQFQNLTPSRVIKLLSRFAKKDGLGIDKGSLRKFYYLFQDKKYLIVVYLTEVEAVEPFSIDKSGFGLQSAWLTVHSIESIRINNPS